MWRLLGVMRRGCRKPQAFWCRLMHDSSPCPKYQVLFLFSIPPSSWSEHYTVLDHTKNGWCVLWFNRPRPKLWKSEKEQPRASKVQKKKGKEWRGNCPRSISKLTLGVRLEKDEEPRTPCLCPKEMTMGHLLRILGPSNQPEATATKVELVPGLWC